MIATTNDATYPACLFDALGPLMLDSGLCKDFVEGFCVWTLDLHAIPPSLPFPTSSVRAKLWGSLIVAWEV